MKLTRRGLLGSVALGLLSFLAPSASAFWQSRDSNYDVAAGPPPAAPSLTLISSTTANATTITIPAHLPGDLIIICADRLSTTAPSLPSGYAPLLNKSSTATNPVSFRVGYKYAKGTDNTADPSGTWTNAAQLYCEIWRASSGYTVGLGAFASATSTTNTVNYPAITLADTTGVSQVIAFCAVANTTETIATAPSGMTNRTSLAGTGIQIAGHDTNGGVASWASTNVVTTGTAGKSVSCTIELMLLSNSGTIAQIYQHVGGGGKSPINGGSPDVNDVVLPMINSSGSGNSLVLALTYPFGQTPTSITDTVNGSANATWPAATIVATTGDASGLVSALYVFPDHVAGQVVITVHFAATAFAFDYDIIEAWGVDASPVNGSQAAANITGPSLATGSFTPGASASGNLILVYAAKSNTGGGIGSAPTTNPLAIRATAPFIVLGAKKVFTDPTVNFPRATLGYLQATPGSINPSLTAVGDVDQYNVVAVALKINGAHGTAPGTGIRIDAFTQNYTGAVATNATYVVQQAFYGNLRMIACVENSVNFADVRDSEGNIWTADGQTAGFWFFPNASPNPNLSVYVTYSGAGSGAIHVWDIKNANASPFDNALAINQSITGLSTFTASPSPSPTNTNGLTVCALGMEEPVGAITSPSGAVFDSPTFAGENAASLSTMCNEETLGHYHNIASGAQTWTFTVTDNTGSGAVLGGFINFKA